MDSALDPFPGLRPVGYWGGPDQSDLPDPAALVDESWDAAERGRVAAVLESAATHRPGEGCSLCRLCGQPNGFLDLTDGRLVWPEGLAHYVREHGVRLPSDVVDPLLQRRDENLNSPRAFIVDPSD